MREIQIGVFMRVYRDEPCIHEAIQSVLEQTHSQLKYYILVNETTKPLIARYALKDNRIEMLQGEKNDGLKRYAKYMALENDYITTIDADDWYDKSYLEELLEKALEQEADIIACGNYFIAGRKRIISERKQKFLVWNVEDSNKVLSLFYGHFRTTWGKLISSKVLLRCEFEKLPDSSKYGGYGGDTIFMFFLLQYAKKMVLHDKTLYYYCMSDSSISYQLREGRLESDEFLYQFVQGVLEKISGFDKEQQRFLDTVYEYALLDTVKLVYNSELSEQEQLEKINYLFGKQLTKKVFSREENLTHRNLQGSVSWQIYQVLLLVFVKHINNIKKREKFLEMFKVIFPETKLDIKSFSVLLKSKTLMETYLQGDFSKLTDMLLVILKVLSESEADDAIEFLVQLSSNEWMGSLLNDKNFVRCYSELIRLLNKNQYQEACAEIRKSLLQNEYPPMAEKLINVWMVLSASLENTKEFILAKQLLVEFLLQTGNEELAQKEYKELVQWGIADANMEYLEKIIAQGEKNNE